MRPPARAFALSLACAVAFACDSPAAPRASAPAPAPAEPSHLDERAVISGQVVERLDGQDYVYLRLSVTRPASEGRGPPARALRWVALERCGAELGDELRVRSLARRVRVYDATVEREFESLDYAAAL